MRACSRRLLAAAVAAVCALGMFAATAGALTSSLDRATGSVVAITAGAERIGTGVVVGTDRVITAAHVVDAAAALPARILVANALVTFDVVAIDRRRDLALLSADIPDEVPAIVFGDSTALKRGEDVIALGFPIGLKSVSLTKGVVSSPLQTYEGVDFVQTDAAINPGNSGGPLVDAQGRLVGLNVAKIALIEVDAVGFSVPAAAVLEFLGRVAPELEPLVDDSVASSPSGGTSGSDGITRSVVAVLAVLTIAAVLAVIAVRARLVRAVNDRAASLAAPADSRGELSLDRAVFDVVSPGDHQEVDLRLPSVAGSAPNADIAVAGADASAYQVRFAAAPGGVLATDLADTRGMYCGDECVATALLKPGESVRLGTSTITYVRSYRA